MNSGTSDDVVEAEPGRGLQRGLTLPAALGVNIISMVGVGPFVTLPLIVIAMGGPQSFMGWVLGALLSLFDGMVWSELGTAYPEAGGSYAYLKNLYGPRGWGKVLSFFYAWQMIFSSPLSLASGCIGFSQYVSYLLPGLSHPLFAFRLGVLPVILSGQTVVAMALCLAAATLLHRKIGALDWLVRLMGGGVILALLIIIVAGATHFHFDRAFDFPAGAFQLDSAFFAGLGAGMLISTYDYGGYYGVCFLGAEVKEPQRTIPRAVIGSIVIVAVLYLLMNVSVLGVIPWREMTGIGGTGAQSYVMAVFMERLYGHAAAVAIVLLIAFAAAASVLALLLSQSRIPYAAAKDGNFPAIFSRVHGEHRIPHVAIRILAGLAMFCCLFRLQEVISTLVVVRIVFQFLLQGVAVMLPKHRAQRRIRGFRMPLYPLPALAAIVGFSFILVSRPDAFRQMRIAAVILLVGAAVYWTTFRRRPAVQEPAD
jgi:amino acid transporter